MNLAGITVLLVDDEELVLSSTAMLLERRGADVLRALSAREALEKASSFSGDIHVAIVDLTMPDTRGDALLTQLKQLFPDINAILCSGYEAEGDTKAIVEAVGATFLHKPIRANDLWETVEKLAQR